MPAQDKKPWFAVKQFGYGVGRPVAWEGWLALSIYIISASAAGLLLSPKAFFIVIVIASLALLYVCRARLDGEWRYRNGD